MTEKLTSTLTVWQRRLEYIRSNWRRSLPLMSGAVGALVILLLVGLLTPEQQLLTSQEVDTAIADALASVTPRPAQSAIVYQIIRPSMVLIETNVLAEDDGIVRDDSESSMVPVQDEGVGSGVIVNEAGAILTSLHVVANSGDIRVTFADGTIANAEVVGTLSDDDVAVLQTDRLPAELIPAVLGNPNAMRIGDEAYVIGHPFGLYGSMSVGVISGFDRIYENPNTLVVMDDLIQVDAATNPGTSGGPLVNRNGQVVGIMTMLLNPTGQDVFIGIGFAVPITTAAAAAGPLPR